MSKYYLYAAAVQGIQEFIFSTNKLRHIVGASELVEQICTSAFNEFEGEGKSIVRAAGNIKYEFQSLDDCKRAFREFPKKIMQMAPGITVSQAVAAYDDESQFGDAIDEVERKLKTQRNKPQKSVLMGAMGIKRANNTGLPTTKIKGEDFMDDSTVQKIFYNDNGTIGLCKKSFKHPNLKIDKNLAFDVSEITGKNDWIAIIHIDGNGLGKVVQKIGKKRGVLSDFSSKLDEAVVNAAKSVYDKFKADGKIDEEKIIPIRPVVLSGDDLTTIIRGDLAMDYCKIFLKAFEYETGKLLGNILKENSVFAEETEEKNYMTACAGIAYVKSSYPFYYAYQLAEDLCGCAKKETKGIAKNRGSEDCLPDSCLMFHKVEDSFITSYDDIVKRNLSAMVNAKVEPLFMAGPYYLSGNNSIEKLEELSKKLNGESGIKSGIRSWISLRIEDKSKADQRLNRMKKIASSSDKETLDCLTDESSKKCVAYDVLAFNTIMNQQTK